MLSFDPGHDRYVAAQTLVSWGNSYVSPSVTYQELLRGGDVIRAVDYNSVE